MVSSSYNSYSSKEEMKEKPTSNSLLHSVQKPQPKPYYSKKQGSSLAPPASTKPKVYKVKPIHFRELVQQLTGAPQHQQQPPPPPPSRLHNTAPPPLPIANRTTLATSNGTSGGGIFQAKLVEKSANGNQDSNTLPIDFLMSPNFQAWCNSFPVLSPGTFSSLDQRNTSIV